MTGLLVLITAVAFYFIGRYSNNEDDKKSLVNLKNSVNEKIRRIKARDIPTVITYLTREETDYEESSRKVVDEEITKNLKKAGLE
ncbi:MAG: hypothetical protein GY861_03090 [bacterium]|nr:hypothetical protein [bacterium]